MLYVLDRLERFDRQPSLEPYGAKSVLRKSERIAQKDSTKTRLYRSRLQQNQPSEQEVPLRHWQFSCWLTGQ